MKKVKLIVHESYQGKRKPEEVFASVLMSNAALTENSEFSIIKSTDLRIHFVPRNTGDSSVCSSEIPE